MSIGRIFRVDFVGRNSAGTETTFSYASEGYTTTSAHPTASLRNKHFEARLEQPLLITRSLYGEGKTYLSNDLEIPHGTVVVNNSDRALDALQFTYGFDAGKLELWSIDPSAPDTDTLEFRGVMEQLILDDDVAIILVRDYSYVLDQALQPTKYLGNNVAPNGLEGSSDLAGRPKPACFGHLVQNIEPVLVNDVRNIFQFHYKQVIPGFSTNTATDTPTFTAGGCTVYDSGVALEWGTSRTHAQMQAAATALTVSAIDTVTDIISFAAPHLLATQDLVHVASTGSLPGGVLDTRYYGARVVSATEITLHETSVGALGNVNKINLTSAGAGTVTVATNRTPYGCWDASSDAAGGSFIRLGLEPIGRITMDAKNAPGGGDWKDVALQLLANVGTYEVDNRMSAVTSLVGHYWTEETTIYRALLDVLRSVNGSMHSYSARPVSAGIIHVTFQRLENPTAPARIELTESNILTGTLKRLQAKDTERGIPPWRFNVRYAKNWTVMSAAEVLDATRRTFAQTEYRAKQYDVALLKLQYVAAPEVHVDTALPTASEADALGNYMSLLYSKPDRGFYVLSVHLEEVFFLTSTATTMRTLGGVILNDVVRITYPGFGFDSGRYLAVIGYTLDHRAQRVDLFLWG